MSYSEYDEVYEVAREFASERLRPAAAQIEDATEVRDRLVGDLHLMGLLPAVSEDHGGQGVLPPDVHLNVIEILAEGDATVALQASASAQACVVIEAAGDADQRGSILLGIAAQSGKVATVAYYEGFGRSPLELEATAARTGEGWLLGGTKRAVPWAQSAEVAVVVAMTDSGLTALVVDATAVEPQTSHPTIALRGGSIGSLSLDGVVVGDDACLGAPDTLELHRAIAWCRLVPAVVALGVGRAAVRYATGYAMQRRAFGREIIDYQGVEFPLVDADMGLDVARLAIHSAWASIETCQDRDVISSLTSSAVMGATGAALNATRVAVNTLGGHGYLTDHPVERWFREATMLAALDYDTAEA